MLAGFDPIVAEWFATRFVQPTPPQRDGWREIAAGHNTLISAPTGSGKTLAAFLICIDKLVRQARAGSLTDETQVVYVSPLKALSNDVQKNLDAPLAEIAALAAAKGQPFPPIRTAVRTGDTPAQDRVKMGRKPPHILVTTPESLYILLTAEGSRKMLRTTTTIIVDEIHAVADDKRGSHLALTLARFDALTGAPAQRIGLSATVNPIEEIAQFLAPDTKIVNTGHRRNMDMGVEVPNDELSAVATHEMWAETYDNIARHIQAHRTTLVFVNSRRLAERAAHALAERVGEGLVLPHHGSLARPLRLAAEMRLKNGDLRAVVATASLELGIDIGTVDLVCQIGSPRSIATALQRFGRSGHWVGALPKARLYPTTRDELIECGALLAAIRAGALEKLKIPRNALDILAQQIVAACATEGWDEDELYDRIRTAYPYRDLPRADFEAVVHMLSDGIATKRGRSGTMLHRDQVNHRLKGRRGARLAAITSGGAIPDNANYQVVVEPDGKVVGTLDEDFAIESTAGDVFMLGTNSWRIKRVEASKVRVEDAHGAPPSVPFWLGEGPGRSLELSSAVSTFREAILKDPAAAREHLNEAGARQAVAYINEAARQLGDVLPSASTVVAERFFDEAGGMQLILHAPFGSRITRAWGLALRKRFCRTFNFELQAAATDNGLVLSLSDQHAFPLELVFEFLKSGSVEYVLSQALLDAPMFGARWRWNASRALAILRFSGGRRTPMAIQRMRAEDLLASVFPDQVACAENLTGPIQIPDHPLVKETMDNCLHEAMDLNGLRAILEMIEAGEIRTVAIDTSQASPFSHEILNANPYAFLDDAPLEERRTRAVQMRRTLGGDAVGSAGLLDKAAIERISAESWPDARNADEMHDALLTLISLPPVPEWNEFFNELKATGRVSVVPRIGMPFWVATERLDQANGVLANVRGWMECLGPFTAFWLAEKLCFPLPEIEAALLRVESDGQAMRGRFGKHDGDEQWCNRRILARIHRATIGQLRREIEPVTTLQLELFQARWQHFAPSAQLRGVEGTLQIIRQLQGFELPANAWESEVLRRRVAFYGPEYLDQLCLSGEVMWGRLSPHPAFADSRRVRPTRLAPVSLFLRDDAHWLMAPTDFDPELLSPVARDVKAVLERQGACFFQELTRQSGHLPSQVEDALWELVAGGLVTADGFDNLRALIDPKRRGEKHGGTKRPRHAGGRWALVKHEGVVLDETQRTEHFARQLLLRWGVLLRDLLVKETITPPWRDLLPVLRRMEAQGEIRGGRFVDSFTGEQFARPEALDLLRAVRRMDQSSQTTPIGGLITLSSSDVQMDTLPRT